MGMGDGILDFFKGLSLFFIYLNSTYFRIIFCSYFIASAKSRIIFLTKVIFPKNDYMDFLLCGRGSWEITLNHSGSILIPSLEMMWPKSFPSSTPKMVFLGFRDIPYFLHLSKIRFKWEI
jgi:hypothetical protein